MRPCLVISPSACAWPNTDHGPVQGATRTFHPGQGRGLCSAACWLTGRSRGFRDHPLTGTGPTSTDHAPACGHPSPEPARLAKALLSGLDQPRGPQPTRRRRAGSLSPRGGPAARWGPSGVPGRRPFAPSRALGPHGGPRACYMCQNGPLRRFMVSDLRGSEKRLRRVRRCSCRSRDLGRGAVRWRRRR